MAYKDALKLIDCVVQLCAPGEKATGVVIAWAEIIKSRNRSDNASNVIESFQYFSVKTINFPYINRVRN